MTLLFNICFDEHLTAVVHITIEVCVRAVQLMLFTSGCASGNIWHLRFLVRSALVLTLL